MQRFQTKQCCQAFISKVLVRFSLINAAVAYGLTLSSPTLGQEVKVPVPPTNVGEGYGNIAIPSMEFVIGGTDLTVGPDDAQLQVSRSYRSGEIAYSASQRLGNSEKYHVDLSEYSETPWIFDLDSGTVRFTGYNSTPQDYDSNGSVFDGSLNNPCLTLRDGAIKCFNGPAYSEGNATVYGLSSNTQANGVVDTITYETIPTNYGSLSRTSSVSNSRGYGIRYTYGVPVTSPCCNYVPAAMVATATSYFKACAQCSAIDLSTVTYSYSWIPSNATTNCQPWNGWCKNYSLTSVTGAVKASERYEYDAEGLLVGAYRPHTNSTPRASFSRSAMNSYATWLQQSDPLGRTLTINVENISTSCDANYSCWHTNYRLDLPGGAVRRYTVDRTTVGVIERNLTSKVVDENGRITLFAYDGTRVKSQTLPDGQIVSFQYDSRGNIIQRMVKAIPSSGLPDKVSTWSYPVCSPTTLKICNKPMYGIDELGHRTNWTWEALHGGMLSEMKGLSSSGSCLIGAICPQKTLTYTSFVGIDGATFWLVSSIADKIDGTQSKLTTYTYDASNGWTLRSIAETADGVIRKTCYNYDKSGRMISTTKPRGAGSACS